jgi:hypothetical protein
MPPAATQKHRTHLGLLIVVAAGIAAGGCFATSRPDATAGAPRNVLSHETAEFRYEYHLVTGRESLYEKCEGTRRFVDVASANAAAVAACRRALRAELGVGDLSDLRRADEDRDSIARLRAIGYL